MNEEKIYEDVVRAAFLKAQQTQIPNQKYKLASYLTTEIQEIANVLVASRTLVNYYDRYVEGKTGTNKPKHENIEFLCQYLGFENYIQYIQSLLINKQKEQQEQQEQESKQTTIARAPQQLIKPISYRYHIVLAILFITGVLLATHLPKEKECMIWVNDHYEIIDCSERQIQFVLDQKIQPEMNRYNDLTVNE